GEGLLEAAVGTPEQRPSVAHRELALLEQLLDRRRQLQQSQCVRDRGPTPADAGGNVVVGETEVFDELLVGRRLLQGVEAVAVQVLDQRLLERRGVTGLADQRGNGLQADPARRPPPALPRDELILFAAVA